MDILIDAWRKIEEKSIHAKLVVTGNFPPNSKSISNLRRLKSATVIAGFISDEDYFKLIRNADYVILSSKRGTNSGIPSTALSLGTDVICSDIPMFRYNSLISPENYFTPESP